MHEPDGPSKDNLTGVWSGSFRYPDDGSSISFTATLIDSRNVFTGSTHEPCSLPNCPRKTHMALVSGRREGTAVSFVKKYDPPDFGYDEAVTYEGTLSADGTEIAGSWLVSPGWSGDFLMVRASRRTTVRARKKLAKV